MCSASMYGSTNLITYSNAVNCPVIFKQLNFPGYYDIKHGEILIFTFIWPSICNIICESNHLYWKYMRCSPTMMTVSSGQLTCNGHSIRQIDPREKSTPKKRPGIGESTRMTRRHYRCRHKASITCQLPWQPPSFTKHDQRWPQAAHLSGEY